MKNLKVLHFVTFILIFSIACLNSDQLGLLSLKSISVHSLFQI